MYRYVLVKLVDGNEVYVNLISSSAGHYVSRHPHILGLAKELVKDVKPSDKPLTIEKDMGRVIGNTDIVNTTETDSIYYAKANKKDVFSRFAKNRLPSQSSILTARIQPQEDGNFELTDIWIGPDCPPFPDDQRATKK